MPLTSEDQIDAAELAIGLLERQERALLLRRVLAEPAFAGAVEDWRNLLTAVFAYESDAAPSQGLLRRLDNIGADVRPWRWVTGLASLTAAGLALALVLRPAAFVPQASVSPTIAYPAAMTVSGKQKGSTFAAVFDPAAGQVRLPLAIAVPADRVGQLWRIGGDGIPHPLGLLSAAQTTTIVLSAPDRAALTAGADLAVSIEAPGGSPTGRPIGRVVATGTITRV